MKCLIPFLILSMLSVPSVFADCETAESRYLINKIEQVYTCTKDYKTYCVHQGVTNTGKQMLVLFDIDSDEREFEFIQEAKGNLSKCRFSFGTCDYGVFTEKEDVLDIFSRSILFGGHKITKSFILEKNSGYAEYYRHSKNGISDAVEISKFSLYACQ